MTLWSIHHISGQLSYSLPSQCCDPHSSGLDCHQWQAGLAEAIPHRTAPRPKGFRFQAALLTNFNTLLAICAACFPFSKVALLIPARKTAHLYKHCGHRCSSECLSKEIHIKVCWHGKEMNTPYLAFFVNALCFSLSYSKMFIWTGTPSSLGYTKTTTNQVQQVMHISPRHCLAPLQLWLKPGFPQ